MLTPQCESSLTRLVILLLSTAILAPCLINAHYHHFGEAINTSPLGSECALLLSGPGRSSVYDYNVNLFRGTLHQATNTIAHYYYRRRHRHHHHHHHHKVQTANRQERRQQEALASSSSSS
uniref:Uncharacterized protein n=1 Tax=Glossina pallidipes TaxID=7398 RepID=A0A1B0A7M0_GLOPL